MLQLVPRLEPEPLGRAVLQLARHLRRRGWRALVASAGGGLTRELAAEGVTHLPLPLDQDGRLARWRQGARLAQAVRRHRITLLHAHMPGPVGSAAGAARRTGVPLAVTCHALDATGRCPPALAGAGAEARRVIAVSEHLQETLGRPGGVEPARLRLVPAWVDTEELDPERVRGHRVLGLAERCGLGDGGAVLLVPGPLLPGQGHLLLIEALARAQRRDFALLIEGAAESEAAYVRTLRAAADAAGIGARLRFAGAVADLPALLALADLVVLPSCRPEPSGYLAAAAQAMGRPVIVTDQGALGEAVLPAATGWLVPPGRADELARAIELALAMAPPVRERLATRARAFVRESFGLESSCERVLAIYRELLRPAATTP
ncbi:MAG: glycosyltransferase [Geminicoccaceae bacterium]